MQPILNTEMSTIDKVSFANWAFPDEATIRADFYEYKLKEDTKWRGRAATMGFRFPMFETLDDFKAALHSAKIVSLTPAQDMKIMNRSHTRSIDDLKGLVGGYHRPRDVDRIVQGFTSGASIPMPIVLKGTKGTWIMAGNTRLDTAFILGIVPKVLLVTCI